MVRLRLKSYLVFVAILCVFLFTARFVAEKRYTEVSITLDGKPLRNVSLEVVATSKMSIPTVFIFDVDSPGIVTLPRPRATIEALICIYQDEPLLEAFDVTLRSTPSQSLSLSTK